MLVRDDTSQRKGSWVLKMMVVPDNSERLGVDLAVVWLAVGKLV